MLVKSKSGKEIGVFAGKVLEVGEGDKRFTISGEDFSVALNYEGERVYISVKEGKLEVETLADKPENNNNGKDETTETKKDEDGSEADDSSESGNEEGDGEGGEGEAGDPENADKDNGEGEDEEESPNGDDSEGTPSSPSRRYTRII